MISHNRKQLFCNFRGQLFYILLPDKLKNLRDMFIIDVVEFFLDREWESFWFWTLIVKIWRLKERYNWCCRALIVHKWRGGDKSERESVWDEADISEKLLYTFHQGFVILWWMFIPFCKSGPIKSETARLMIPCLIPLNFSVLLKTVTKCWHGEANYLSPVAVGVW